MRRAGIPPGQRAALLVPYTDAGRGTLQRRLGNVEIAVAGLGDVVGTGHVRPHIEELALGSEHLDPAVFPVANVNQPFLVNQQTVGQVKLTRTALARYSPGGYQSAVAAEPVHPAVPVSVGNIKVSRRRGVHFRRKIEGPRRSRHQRASLFATGVGMHTPISYYHEGLSVQRVLEADRVLPVGEVDHVVNYAEPVGQIESADSPRINVVSFAVEHHDGRVLALVNVNPVLGIAGHRAHHAEGPTLGQPGPVLDQFVIVLVGVDQSHIF